MGLEVIITNDFEGMSEEAANILISQMRRVTIDEKRGFNLGLATGKSPKGLYDKIIERQREFDATKIISWNMDEYVGLPGETPTERLLHHESYTFFMIKNLFGKLEPNFAKTHVPRGAEIDQLKLEIALKEGTKSGYVFLDGSDKGKALVIRPECDEEYLRWIRDEIMTSYINSIRWAGGIDYWVVGIGEKGHIAFHESGIPLHHEMLLVKLDDNTINNAVKDSYFKSADVPHYAISIGAGGLFRYTRNVLLLAYGERKTESVALSLLGPVTPNVPASGLQAYAQMGGSVICVLDEIAAKGIVGKNTILNKNGITIIDLRQ